MSFLNREQHGFPLWLVTSSNPHLLSKLCCYSLGSLVMTAFTHNVCALFCKLMVVDVCLLLLYIHYESCFRHSMSLSELLLCFWTNSPWPKIKKKIGNKMLLSSKKIVKSDLWVKKIIKMELNLHVWMIFFYSSILNFWSDYLKCVIFYS